MGADYSDFKDRHIGQEIIIAGNGPGLLNVPVEFLNSRPSFALNYGSWYLDVLADGSPSPLKGWEPDYWHGLDPQCYRAIDRLPETVYAFVSEKDAHDDEYQRVVKLPNVVHYRCYDEVEGVGNTDGLGPSYSSSLFTATHIAHHMGATRFLYVGFECTFVANGTKRVGDWDIKPGINLIPHWYNGSAVKYLNGEEPYVHAGMDENAAICRSFMDKMGKEIINLSEPSFCDRLITGTIEDYMEDKSNGST